VEASGFASAPARPAAGRRDPRHLWATSDLFCLTGVQIRPAASKGSAWSIWKPRRAALPSIATAIGGVPDAVIDGETGLLAAPMPTPWRARSRRLPGSPQARGFRRGRR